MKKLRITIGKKSYDVTVEVLDEGPAPVAAASQARGSVPAAAPPSEAASPAPTAPVATAPGGVPSPMAGVIKSILVKPGDEVQQGQELVILEAMKMENKVAAPHAGSVKSVEVSEGESVTEGQMLAVLE